MFRLVKVNIQVLAWIFQIREAVWYDCPGLYAAIHLCCVLHSDNPRGSSTKWTTVLSWQAQLSFFTGSWLSKSFTFVGKVNKVSLSDVYLSTLSQAGKQTYIVFESQLCYQRVYTVHRPSRHVYCMCVHCQCVNYAMVVFKCSCLSAVEQEGPNYTYCTF